MPPTSAEDKKARKKKERSISEAEYVELFLGTELLRDLPESALNDLARGKAELREVAPGAEVLHLPAGRTDKTPLLVLVSGALRVCAAMGDGASTILNILLQDDLFFDRSHDPEGALELSLIAVQPTKVLQIGYADANALLRDDESFQDKFTELLGRSDERKNQFFDDPELRPIAEFLADSGLVGLQRLKVKRLDKCIDCDACFEACAERRGVCRLGDYQTKHERIGVPFNCHNCSSPACQPSCRFGHIQLASGELVISDDCAGCSACKKACPYSAITTLPLESIPDGFLERSANAKGKQVALKCDNCIDYPDQACISACPTGSIFQITSKNFQDYLAVFATKSTRAIEKMGADIIDVEKAPWIGWKLLFIGGLLLATLITAYESIGRMYIYRSNHDILEEKFVNAGLSEEKANEIVKSAGIDIFNATKDSTKPLLELELDISESQAKKIQGEFRKYKIEPWKEDWRTKYFSLTALLYQLNLRKIPPQTAKTMKPGNNLSMLLGYLGAWAMLLSQLYRVRRDVGSRLGNMRTWLEFHIYAGYLGGMLIFFHATYMFHGYVFWLCFVPMVIAILTGVLGRYVYFLIPRSAAGRAMDENEIRSQIMNLNQQIERVIKECKGGAKALEEVKRQDLLALPTQEAAESSWWKTLFQSFVAGFGQRSRAHQLTTQLAGLAHAEGKNRKELGKLVSERSGLEGAARRIRSLEILTGSWRWVHVAASYLMFLAMMVHTVYAWIFLGTKALIAQ